MIRLKALIAYDGTDFCGWQVQENQPTIQAEIESALERICGKKTGVVGSGRTDSGVHAYGQVAHFDWDHPLKPEKLILGMNALLPQTIRVLELQTVAADFHARYDAQSKIYLYRIDRNRIESPFSSRFALHYSFPLNINTMRECSRWIEGEHDFVAFQASGSDTGSTVRKVLQVELLETSTISAWPLPSAEGPHHNFLYIRIQATGFLRKMVRFLTGTLLEIGAGKREPEDLKNAIEQGNRDGVGIPLPGRGLFLERVYY